MQGEPKRMGLTPKTFTFQGIEVHYLEGGAGKPLLLLHGSGPGASTIGNWRRVLEPLCARYHVFAMDLIGFGQSGRRPQPPFFDVDFWLDQSRALLAMMPGERIGLVGHSLSGALALKLAASNPRITQVLTTGSMGAPFTPNADTRLCWTFPQTPEALRRTAAMLIFDTSLIDDAYIAARRAVLFEDPGYAPYFRDMFAADAQTYADAAVLSDGELSQITCPVCMLHGRNDTAFPPEISLRLASCIAQADVTILARCSHSVAMEHPAKFLAAAHSLFQ
jgi:2-hydroxymuconate-semialdehyde hydrolase